jgi:hypothetical protein
MHAAAGAFEQLDAEVFFEPADPAAERRLLDFKGGRRSPEA